MGKAKKKKRRTWWRRKKSSGNGTSATQWYYSMLHLPFFWCIKPGITGNLFKRWIELNEDVFGFWIPIAFVKIPWAYNVEQRFLKATRWAKVTIFGKGGTEIRFIIPGILSAFQIYILGVIKYLTIILVIVSILYLIKYGQ